MSQIEGGVNFVFCLEHDIIDHNIVMQLARFVFGVFDEMIITCVYFFVSIKPLNLPLHAHFLLGAKTTNLELH